MFSQQMWGFLFFYLFKKFLYYKVMKLIYDFAELCKRLYKSEHKNTTFLPD